MSNRDTASSPEPGADEPAGASRGGEDVRALEAANEALEEKVRERTRELQEALHRLETSERSFERLVDSVTDYALFMLDPDGRIVSWNTGAQRIKGYAANEIIGQHFSRFYTEEDRATGLPERGLRTAAQEGRFEAEGWRVRKDGSRFLANVVIDAIRANGELVGFAKITRDITERRAAENRLREAQKMEAVGRFTGGVAHDFNNLLMAVLGSLELLRKQLPNDKRMLGLLDNAVEGARRGATLTQRMLAFARRQELKPEPVDIPRLTRGMMETLERLVGAEVTIETRFPGRLRRALTDPSQLETALVNLTLNARDAMDGRGTLAIAATERHVEAGQAGSLTPGLYVRLCVRDTGGGMDEATLARVREPFFTTKGVGKGTGLGLSMVDGLAAQSGGRLVIESQLGQGTTVELWLPAAEDEASVLEEVEVHAPAPAPSPRRALILAVDDDSLVLMNTTAMLEDLGHQVIDVGSGVDALAVLDAHPEIDLVVSDQAMPGMTGLELVELIRKLRPELPIILATGYAELPAHGDPGVSRLAKPFTQADLAKALAARGF
jgi:PAS domain S-box-containing protein